MGVGRTCGLVRKEGRWLMEPGGKEKENEEKEKMVQQEPTGWSGVNLGQPRSSGSPSTAVWGWLVAGGSSVWC